MKNLSSKKLLYMAIFLILASNAIILGAVAFNRSYKEPERIILTERELKMPYGLDINGPNSGISLRLSYSSLTGERRYHSSPMWLDRAKLLELGFDLPKYEKYCHTRERPMMPSKSVYMVFELNGKEHANAIEQAKERLTTVRNTYNEANVPQNERPKQTQASRVLEETLHTYSRLYTLDASLDRSTLRERYPDPSKYFITKTVVFPNFSCSNESKITQGYIDRINHDLLHVNSKMRDTLLKAWSMEPYGFKAKISTGALGYMWLESIQIGD